MALFEFTPEKKQAFCSALEMLFSRSAVSCLFFSDDEIEQLSSAALSLEFRTAKSVVGNGVYQDFDICFPAPLEGCFQACAQLLEQAVSDYDATHYAHAERSLTEGVFKINDFAVQNYPPGSRGIGIHRDGLRYRNFVFIITLSGVSELFVCSDRNGHNKQPLIDTPGHLVILPAPGFAGLGTDDDRPLHGVEHVSGGRLSIGFRQERLAAR